MLLIHIKGHIFMGFWPWMTGNRIEKYVWHKKRRTRGSWNYENGDVQVCNGTIMCFLYIESRNVKNSLNTRKKRKRMAFTFVFF